MTCLVQASAGTLEKSVQEDLKAQVIEEGLENHTTQGSHGVNYHHPDSGSSGYQFFMPTRKPQSSVLVTLPAFLFDTPFTPCCLQSTTWAGTRWKVQVNR